MAALTATRAERWQDMKEINKTDSCVSFEGNGKLANMVRDNSFREYFKVIVKDEKGNTKTLGVSQFRFGSGFAAVAALKRRGGRKRSDFSMVRIRLARFALPRFGFSGSKSGVFCSPLVCRVRGTIENVRASAALPERYPGILSQNHCNLIAKG